MKSILTSLIICFLTTSVLAQKETDTIAVKKIAKLSFMQGNWKGEGWFMTKNGKKEFVQTETLRPKVENTLLVIDGIGYAKEGDKITDRIIHNAFGVISYNKKEDKYIMLSFSSSSEKMENELKITDDKKMQWSFKDVRGGTITFKEDFTEDGVWVETGDYTFNNGQSFPFFYMKLIKQ